MWLFLNPAALERLDFVTFMQSQASYWTHFSVFVVKVVTIFLSNSQLEIK